MARYSKWMILLTVVLALCAFVPGVWARAGGGGHFSGGGGFGGGGGFSGGGGWGGGSYHSGGGYGRTTPFDTLVILAIIILIVFVAPIIRNYIDSMGSKGVADAVAASQKAREAEAIDAIRTADPSFDAAAFYQRVTNAFLKTQAAWCGHDLNPIRPFVSDGIFERFLLQIAEQKDLGVHDQMDQLEVQSIGLDQVVPGSHFDVAVVRVNAAAADYEVSLQSGKPVRGRSGVDSFTEYWSFVRRKGATTRNAAGLMEGNCPNCGAKVEINETTNCPSCKAVLRSGLYDWVLAVITQASEWREIAAQHIPGVAELQTIDPDFTIQHVEDRASVMFWRKAMAARVGSIDPMRKIATDQCATEYGARLANHAPRTWWGECGVGSVMLRQVILDADFHKAIIEIHWSGTRFDLLADGRIQRGDEGSVTRSVFVLVRSAGAKSNAEAAISSAHCPNCGAPERIESSNACDYCHAILNDRTQDWVLAAILPYTSAEATQLLHGTFIYAPEIAATHQMPPAINAGNAGVVTPSTNNLVAWMLKMALADGEISAAEQRVITEFAKVRGMSQSRFDVLKSAATCGALDIHDPSSQEERRVWMAALARAALADGKLDAGELALLRQVGARYGLVECDIKMILNKARRELLENAAP